MLGIERLLSDLRGFFFNTYTLRPHPPPAHSDWRPTRVSRVVLVDCNVVVVVRLVLFISTSHQWSSSIDHCVGTGFGPFNLPTCASLPLRRDHSHQRSLVGYSSSLLLVVLWFSLFVLLSVCNRYTHPSRYCSGTVTLIRIPYSWWYIPGGFLCIRYSLATRVFSARAISAEGAH